MAVALVVLFIMQGRGTLSFWNGSSSTAGRKHDNTAGHHYKHQRNPKHHTVHVPKMGDLANQIAMSRDRSDLPLAKFPTLPYALDNAELVGIYFASSWCPMSTPVTNLLSQSFSPNNQLLQPEGTSTTAPVKRKPLALVYVSSDKTKESMEEYSKDKGWIDVPFDTTERTDLKRHFRTCAKIELAEMGFERKHEIPTLIIIDSQTHGILTTDGVADLKDHGASALDEWIALQQAARGMEDKYL
jgi:hypothetical protein